MAAPAVTAFPSASTPLRIVFEGWTVPAAMQNMLAALGAVIGPNAHVRFKGMTLDDESGGSNFLAVRLGTKVITRGTMTSVPGQTYVRFENYDVADGAAGDDISVDVVNVVAGFAASGHILVEILRP